MPKHTRIVALGGTFDHFHVGHQHFLTFAAGLGGKLLIGVTTSKMTQHKPLAETIQPFAVRKRAVISFCRKENIPCEVVPLDDQYGVAATDTKLYGLALTEMTIEGGQAINDLRRKMGLRPLETAVCSMLKDTNGEIISSRRIRAGEIDRERTIYKEIFKETLTINKDQRDFFSQPQDEIVDRFVQMVPSPKTCVVGDMSLETFIKHSDPFDLAVFDQQQQRTPTSSQEIKKIKPDLVISNSAGTISTELITALETALGQEKKFIQVSGEEDLAAVALALLLPLESVVYYGQPGEGMVAMQVTEGLKHTFYKVLTTT